MKKGSYIAQYDFNIFFTNITWNINILFSEALSVQNINGAINGGDPVLLMKALKNPSAQLPPVHDSGDMLYLEEFCNMKNEKESDLDYDEIYAAVKGEIHGWNV